MVIKEEAIMTILDDSGDLIGVVYLTKNRDKVFFKATRMGDEDIMSIINDKNYGKAKCGDAGRPDIGI